MYTERPWAPLLCSLALAALSLNACIEDPTDPPEGCERDGQRYELGATFSDDNGCNTCSCDESGRITCTDRECVTCEHEGMTYNQGEAYSPDDNCNTCTCGEDGAFSCTRRSCDEPSCDYNGQRYAIGESFPASDGCNTCSCDESGQALCSAMPCVSGCEHQGNVYMPGESFPAGDGCNQCVCEDGGSASCTEAVCDPIGPMVCSADADCAEGFSCSYERMDCGRSEGSVGSCVMMPDVCPSVEDGHFCGCDGSYYSNSCQAGNYDQIGGCQLPNGTEFVCGDITCALGLACGIAWNDVFGPDQPAFYASCLELGDCEREDPCDCFEAQPGERCELINGRAFIFSAGG